MKNSKINKRLRSLWYKKDITGWITFKFKYGRYPSDMSTEDIGFKEEMLVWDIQLTHVDVNEEATLTKVELGNWDNYTGLPNIKITY